MPNVRGKENTEKKNDHIPLGKKKKVNRAINTRKKTVVCLYVLHCATLLGYYFSYYKYLCYILNVLFTTSNCVHLCTFKSTIIK